MPNQFPSSSAPAVAGNETQVAGKPSSVVGQAESYETLKGRQDELSSQLESVQQHRDELVSQSHGETGAARVGLEGRIGLLDDRLRQIETDLASVGRAMVTAAPRATVEPTIIYRGNDDEDMVGAGFGGAAIMFAIFIPFIVMNWRRRKRAAQFGNVPGGATIADPRIDRMENAIDAVAVEIERISENQRFMTRLMTETQLAGSIAAVRGSTELAKVAAEGQSNG